MPRARVAFTVHGCIIVHVQYLIIIRYYYLSRPESGRTLCRSAETAGMYDLPTRYGPAPPWAPLVLIALLLQSATAGQRTTGGRTTLGGIPGTMARALNRIRGSTNDQQLTDDLWLERLPVVSARKPTTEYPTPADLLDLADAVFDTHRLSWRNAIVPGVDFNVYKDKTQTYRFYVARNRNNGNVNTGNNN